ncbi:MAG: efflux RND transporter periplasmic adaptor subunit [Pseudomonadales bacterium]
MNTPNNKMEYLTMKNLKLWVVCLSLTLATPLFAQTDDHDDHEDAASTTHQEKGHGENENHDNDDHADEDGHADEDDHGDEAGHSDHEGEEEEGGSVTITPAQQKTAGIVVEPLVSRRLAGEIAAPGEVKLNAYLTRKVTPRITAQVMERHARLGDQVSEGQPLITLSSVDMAEAQGTLQVAELEWLRVKSLGRDTVSARRYTEAQVAQQQARARVRAYGMSTDQITALVSNSQFNADGSFQLVAPQAGTVISDEFIEGEFVEPGRVLFEVSDESRIWVEASLTPEEAFGIERGAVARVRAGGSWFEGEVIQAHHVLDETTRTLAIRIEIQNADERLHPGLFVDTRIGVRPLVDAIAVPEEAVLRSPDGDWVVFIEGKPGEFEPKEVELLRTVQGLAVIDGVEPGTRVVTQGAFFVQSELAKSGFQVHNH